MLKFFYRLKRRGGVVLFAVIAIMTLLITMASVAYFTARSSYKTVVSNYDFSQTYISATSIADMLISSVSQQSSRDTVNKFSELKTLIGNMEDYAVKEVKNLAKNDSRDIAELRFRDSGKTSYITYYVEAEKNPDGSDKITEDKGTPDENVEKNTAIVGSTNNIKGKSGDELLSAAGESPVKEGIFDAVYIDITLERIVPDLSVSSDNKYSSNYFYYTFTTTAYYRENSISVQDTVYHLSSPASGSEPPKFDTFFTATGQVLDALGNPSEAKRVVIIGTQNVSDNAYFQNDDTYLGRFADTLKFEGGIQSTGNVWIDGLMNGTKLAASTGNRRHDWIIGGDLYISGASTSINFNGNCLYVKGDLYLGSKSELTNLGCVIVEGNIYNLDGNHTHLSIGNGESTNNGFITKPGVYVGGIRHLEETGIKGGVYNNATDATNIYDWVSFEFPAGISEDDQKNYIPAEVAAYPTACPDKYKSYHNAGSTEYEVASTPVTYTVNGKTVKVTHHTLTIGNYINVFNSFCRESFKKGKDTNNGNNFSIDTSREGGTHNFTNGKLYIDSDMNNNSAVSAESDGYSNLDVLYSSLNITKNDKGELTGYHYDISSRGVDDLLSPDSGLKRRQFATYTASQDTLDNVLELDFNKITASGTTVLGSVDGKDATVTCSGSDNIGNCQDIVIDLPYVENGYILKMKADKKIVDSWWDESVGGPVYHFERSDKLEFPWDGNAKVTYRIHTGDKDGSEYKTMPIVLAANFFDGDDNASMYGSTRDENDRNAFSWSGGSTGNGGSTRVELVRENSNESAQGFVIFEMGNIKKSTGEYVPYDKTNISGIDQVVYYCSQKEIVGTKNQIDYLNGKDTTKNSTFEGMFDTTIPGAKEAGVLQAQYQNKILLVSNKNDSKTAIFTGGANETVLCGYLYAPNGSYMATNKDVYGNDANNNDQHPVFGGMIVSDYTVIRCYYMYAQPDPNLIEGLTNLDSFEGKNGIGADVWYTDGDGMGENYLG